LFRSRDSFDAFATQPTCFEDSFLRAPRVQQDGCWVCKLKLQKLESLPDELKFHFTLASLGKTGFMPQLAEALTAHFTNRAKVNLFEVGKHRTETSGFTPT